MQFVAAGKPRGSLSTKRQDVEFLRSNGFHVGTNAKPCRIRRSMDKVAALAALKTHTENPFEPNTRQWKTFNRYAAVGHGCQL